VKTWVEKGIRKYRNAEAVAQSIQHSDVKRILVIRHAALGDMLQTRPFLYELKKFFPNAHIKLSIISNYTIGAPTDLVDEVEILPGRDQKKPNPIQMIRQFRSHQEFDLLFDLASTTRSQIQTMFTKAKLKLGFPYRNIPWIYHFAFFRSEFRYETELLLEFLNLFGHISEYPLNFQLPNHPLQSRARRLSYFPSSSMQKRNYPMDWMRQLIELNAQKYPDYDHFIIQGALPSESFLELYSELKHLPNVKLREKSKLEDLLIWMSESRYLVANDTGVRHLAIAVGTPTLGFFTQSIPYRNYNPHDVRHICHIHPDGSFPTPEEVHIKMQHHLSKINA
jgi:ADP-heptose:LPS heptosyltransferase